ncbi:flavodoxin family protein [Hungatella hathewayi]|uniref:flavodoxin family protein n=1 Tax=Hungatella hathewayi TaxID=154046 RepID=UPI00210F0413|nr:flavodoxin family protein [Hungatella hathewayi]MCQ5384386.1 flavodoxin family protein [Hungatella hathewayi]
MKVMAIVAGRHDGNSEILAKEALLACQEAGAEVSLINLYDYNILPCTGCEACSMGMAQVAMGKGPYKGCALKGQDDVDKIITEMQKCNGLIVSCPTYDLAPSSLLTRLIHRQLAYELSFMLKVGLVKEDPHCVAGLIAVGGSRHDWMTMSLEVMAAGMFTQSVKVIDQFLATGNSRPGNVLLHPEQMTRARQMGENIIKTIGTPIEKREWLGEPDMGMCPNCHSSLIFRGEPHWDGIEFPFECAVCGAGGDLVRGEDGKVRFVLVENGLCRDRNVNEYRELHLDEIMKCQGEFFANADRIQEEYAKYKAVKFPAV